MGVHLFISAGSRTFYTSELCFAHSLVHHPQYTAVRVTYVLPAAQPYLSELWAVCASPSLSDSFMPVQPLSHPIKTSPPRGSACLCECVFVCVEYHGLVRCLSEAGLHKAGARCQKYLFHP